MHPAGYETVDMWNKSCGIQFESYRFRMPCDAISVNTYYPQLSSMVWKFKKLSFDLNLAVCILVGVLWHSIITCSPNKILFSFVHNCAYIKKSLNYLLFLHTIYQYIIIPARLLISYQYL